MRTDNCSLPSFSHSVLLYRNSSKLGSCYSVIKLNIHCGFFSFFSFFSFHLWFCQLPSGIIFACKLFSYRQKEKNNCYDLSVGSLQHKCHQNPCAECPVQAGPSMAPLVWILWPALWMPSVVVVFLAWEGSETDSDNLNSAFGLQYLKKRV